MPDSAGQITKLLDAMRAGDSAAEGRLMEAVYPELRRIAARYLQRERAGHTLQPTALVNEAYLHMLGHSAVHLRNRAHFFAAAARSMRRILVDYARMRKAAKREGQRQRIELLDVLAISEDRLEEMIALDEALDRLAEFDARQSRVVELRFFAGLTEDETAEVMGIASRTVSREWNVARAWLHGELNSPGN